MQPRAQCSAALNSAIVITSYTILPRINSPTVKNKVFWVERCIHTWSLCIKSKYVDCPENKHCGHWGCLYFGCCAFICLHIVSLFVRSSAKWLNVNLNVNVEQLQGKATVVYFTFTTRGHGNKQPSQVLLCIHTLNNVPDFMI